VDDETGGTPYPLLVARDDEFRKVAEDIGALARSLGRDFREAVDQAVRGGSPPGRAVRHGLRGLTNEARRGMRSGWHGRHGHGRYWAPRGRGPGYGGRGRPGWTPPPAPGGPGAPGTQTTGQVTTQAPPWTQGRPWVGPAWNGPRRRRRSLPPVRHRWDATTVAGLLAVLFGVAWLVGATGVLHVSIEAIVAVGLMLLGASLVVTGRTDWSLSRRSWPVWLGAGLIVVLIATSTTFGLGGALDSVSFGTTKAPINAAAPPGATVHGGFGDLNATVTGQPAANETVRIASVAGRTTVNFDPKNANYQVLVNARVVGGQICVNGTNATSGLFAQNPPQQLFPVGNPGQQSPILTLDIHQVFGQILVNSTDCVGGTALPPTPPSTP
jgi:hypothetical protein